MTESLKILLNSHKESFITKFGKVAIDNPSNSMFLLAKAYVERLFDVDHYHFPLNKGMMKKTSTN